MPFWFFVFTNALFAANFALAQLSLGDKVPNLCWYDAQGGQVCLYDWKDTDFEDDAHVKLTRVLVYSAGHCQSCQPLVQGLGNGAARFKYRKVVFATLLSEGWKAGTLPTTHFLKDFAGKFHLSVPILASPEDQGRVFFGDAGVPGVVIIKKDNTLGYKARQVGAQDVFAALERLLASETK
jgi:hypothetical protein